MATRHIRRRHCLSAQHHHHRIIQNKKNASPRIVQNNTRRSVSPGSACRAMAGRRRQAGISGCGIYAALPALARYHTPASPSPLAQRSSEAAFDMEDMAPRQMAESVLKATTSDTICVLLPPFTSHARCRLLFSSATIFHDILFADYASLRLEQMRASRAQDAALNHRHAVAQIFQF